MTIRKPKHDISERNYQSSLENGLYAVINGVAYEVTATSCEGQMMDVYPHTKLITYCRECQYNWMKDKSYNPLPVEECIEKKHRTIYALDNDDSLRDL